jgi:hypothetical protein
MSIYFAIIKALKKVDNIINRDISPRVDSFKKLGSAKYRVFI